MTWFLRKPPEIPEPFATALATIAALEKRVGELERNEHGHCTQCGKPTPTGCMTHCSPDTPCPKARAA